VSYISDFENFLLVESDSPTKTVFNGIWDPMVDSTGKRHWRLNVLASSKLRKVAEDAHGHFQSDLETELKDVVLLCPANFMDTAEDLDLMLIVEKKRNHKKETRTEIEGQMEDVLSNYLADQNPRFRGKEIQIEASLSDYFPRKLGVYSVLENKWLQSPPSDQKSNFVGVSVKKIIREIKKLQSGVTSSPPETQRKKIQKISRQIQRLKKSGPEGLSSYDYLLSGGYIHQAMDLMSKK
jgi:hypothetical protein